jgi:glycosyltransferase involved in cell wall biosynthesis
VIGEPPPAVRPEVTVVVPVLDEEANVLGCLDAIAAQDLPLDLVELLVVDGGSRDHTVELCRGRLEKAGFHHAEVITSDNGSRPGNLNAGLARAQGRVLCRVDARSRIPRHYLRRCRDVLAARSEVSVVGGRQRACVVDDGVVQVGIARALNNRWATGLSRYRRAADSGRSDTVYLGAFRTEELRAAGGWRADLPVNEDYELNRRMGQWGLVWFDAELVVDYVPRDSLPALLRQYLEFGRSKARYWKATGDRPQPRQLVLLGAPVAAALVFGGALVVAPAPLRAAALIAGAGFAGAVEVLGADSPRGSVRAHLAGLTATSCLAAGWLLGVWGEMATPRARR